MIAALVGDRARRGGARSGAVAMLGMAALVGVVGAVAVYEVSAPEPPPPTALPGMAPATWSEATPETERAMYTAMVAVEGCPSLRANRTQWVISTAIAGAESGYIPSRLNDNPATGDLSFGLWQINMIGAMGPGRRAQYGIATNEELLTALVNAKAMCTASGGGANWMPWSTYTNYDFQDHMAEAEAAVAAAESGKSPPGPLVSGGVLLPNSEGLDPDFAQRLAGLANATLAATGGTATITSGFRSIQEQRAIIANHGGVCGTWVACVYGNTCGSDHCKGTAADMAWSTDDADDYWHAHAREWGLNQCMSWEAWHFSPIAECPTTA